MLLTELNQFASASFIEHLADIFEHSPWVAEGALATRPYSGIDELHQAMVNVVECADLAQQLALIRAHPELAGKAAIRGELTAASTNEQQGAGLNACSAEEFQQLQYLNQRYNEQFGFPFIIAVKGHNRESIIQAFTQRLANSREQEIKTALTQIYQIAYFRLHALLA
ncbi:2-oxo-4-hydroxy-4-carboxy-5-ureidoimidazoline decarboxylase [Aeromonas cavernicola]|uniref:2-oxo-4-hydroxy-4-carboxy-5-ureidoimidazoline decarboxylase n=1 Tax=Aeromonas cavernicola TaxID=1006623 RepID=A0A2H9U558_9GAMM|nr:2-oxo-4-hydroxy-4-carboxy-5-ureidoimidazoline decarboxylase [Aeromonas cavernicola]PJG59180.1 OHCU decarboxylase [Aeromonas cavernicola]